MSFFQLRSSSLNEPVLGTAVLSTTIIDEADIVAGGDTITITLFDGTWVTAGATFDAQRANIIAGLDSAQSEATGWDAVVKAGLAVTDVVRTSDTVVTVTLSAFGTYNITSSETISCVIPSTALTKARTINAYPSFSVSAVASVSAVRHLALLGVG